MDSENAVVKTVRRWYGSIGSGDLDDARRLFVQAWETARDAFESCIAAHYVARHQASPEDELRWNVESLRLADAVGDERVKDFYPSLLLNIGHAQEVLGHSADGRRYYDLAAVRARSLPGDRYGMTVRGGVAAGQQRLGGNEG